MRLADVHLRAVHLCGSPAPNPGARRKPAHGAASGDGDGHRRLQAEREELPPDPRAGFSEPPRIAARSLCAIRGTCYIDYMECPTGVHADPQVILTPIHEYQSIVFGGTNKFQNAVRHTVHLCVHACVPLRVHPGRT